MTKELPPLPCHSQEILEMDEMRRDTEKSCLKQHPVDLQKVTRLKKLMAHVDAGGSLELTYIITMPDDGLKNKRVEMHLENKRKL